MAFQATLARAAASAARPRPEWISRLSLPVIASPMFLVSGTKLVTETCKTGVVGTFPALNARTDDLLDKWLEEIKGELASHPSAAPFGINLIVHKTNPRIEENLKRVVKHKVPIVITSLGAVKDVVDSVHSYGGIVLHDVTNATHAKKAIQAGVDGLIAVCAGAGGHAGAASPFALIPQIRSFFDGILVLGGAISDGRSVRAAEVLGADLAYMGTRFIPTVESQASEEYKKMIAFGKKDGPSPFFLPTVHTDKISGVYANFIRESLERAGLNPENPKGEGLGHEDFSKMQAGATPKAWKDVWSAGHGIVNIHDIHTVAALVAQLKSEYTATLEQEKKALQSKL